MTPSRALPPLPEYLESREFYESCQAYRTASPMSVALFFECLKKDIALAAFSANSRALAAISSSTAGGWRPIETAPKDGTEVWAFNGEQARMHWTEGEISGVKWALWIWTDQLLAAPDQPTHWMPLPPPPSADA
jgi:hypothetical protein